VDERGEERVFVGGQDNLGRTGGKMGIYEASTGTSAPFGITEGNTTWTGTEIPRDICSFKEREKKKRTMILCTAQRGALISF